MSTEKPRFTVTVSDEMKKSIEDFYHARRFKNQSQAVNQLIERGLDSLLEDKAKSTSPCSSRSAHDISLSELAIIKKYRALDEHGKELVELILEKELERVDALADSPAGFETCEFRVSDQPAAAGFGVYLGPESFHTVVVRSDDLPRHAAFGVPVSGDSMEPKYHDGDILIVSAEKPVRGEVGIYTMDGQGYVKVLGNGELLSLNSAYAPIPMKEGIICNGKVIGVLDSSSVIDG